MQLRPAALNSGQHRRPRRTILGTGIGLHVDFLDSIERQQDRWSAKGAALPDGFCTTEGIEVIRAADDISVELLAAAIDWKRSKRAAGRPGSGGECFEIARCLPAYRQRAHLLSNPSGIHLGHSV